MGADSPPKIGALLAGLGAGSRVAGYRLEDRLGAGGMAVVFRARDQRLGRLVALKVLAPQLAADEGFRHRFIRESRAAAAVDDPHIIPVYEAGEADGVLFIAMRLVAAGDLRQLISQAGRLPAGRAAGFVSPVASALDAAHNAGLVHRDVKPANILVDTAPMRPDHVYLSDFGLSKGIVSSVSLTGSGQFVGTPDYCAPEQVSGAAVTGQTDQYALACVAFELLAGVPPFVRDQPMATLWAHLSQPAPALTLLRPDLSRAADQVLGRALAKAPQDRYGSCQEFADALLDALGLTRHASAVPEPAEPDHPPTEIARHLNPGAGIPAVQAELTTAATVSQPGMAGQHGAAAGNMGPAIRVDSTPAPTGPDPDRHIPDDDVRAWPVPVRRTVAVVVLLTAMALVAAAALAGSVSHWFRPGSPRGLVATLADSGHNRVNAVAFSPDGKTLATGVGDGRTYLWNVTARRRIATLPDPGSSGVFSTAFSPDGNTLATVDGNGNTYLWDTRTTNRIATLPDPADDIVTAVAFSADGNILATADGDGATGSTYLWDTRTTNRIATLADPGSKGDDGVAFSPDGKTLAAGDGNGRTYLWNITTRHRIATLPDPGHRPVNAIAFSPDGQALAATDGVVNGNTYLWNVTTGHLIATLPNPGGMVAFSAAFSPDGKMLATEDGLGKNAYLWNVTTRHLTATLPDPGSSGVSAVAFSPDGKTLATADGNGHAYLWDILRATSPP